MSNYGPDSQTWFEKLGCFKKKHTILYIGGLFLLLQKLNLVLSFHFRAAFESLGYWENVTDIFCKFISKCYSIIKKNCWNKGLYVFCDIKVF